MTPAYVTSLKTIEELGDHVINLRKMWALNSSMTEYIFDKHILGHRDNESYDSPKPHMMSLDTKAGWGCLCPFFKLLQNICLSF